MVEDTNAGVTFLVSEVASTCGLGLVELGTSFRRARFFAAAVNCLSSPGLICCFRAFLHFVRSDARLSNDIDTMSTVFISLMQTYLYRR